MTTLSHRIDSLTNNVLNGVHSLEEALSDVKRRFGLGDSAEHDICLRDVLSRRLAFRDGRYVWPREVRSALVYWDVGPYRREAH